MMGHSKKTISVALTSMSLVLFSNLCFAFQTEISGYSSNPGNANAGATCTQCHTPSGGVVPPSVYIQGPTTVEAGSTNTYKLTMVRQDNNVANKDKIGGVNISVDTGKLYINDKDLKAIAVDPNLVLSVELSHSIPVNSLAKKVLADGKTITWLFDWEAPLVIPAQPMTVYASLLSGDNNSLNAGDSSRTISLQVNVVTTVNDKRGLPEAKIMAPFSGEKESTMAFIASGSSISSLPDKTGTGYIEKYEWTFSDEPNKIYYTEQVTKNLSTTGPFTANLKVFTNSIAPINSTLVDNRLSATTFIDVNVTAINDDSEVVPVPRISAPLIGSPGVPIRFDASGSTPSGIKLYFWDFGDDTLFEKSALAVANHTFAIEGIYTVTLAVQTLSGYTNVETFNIEIKNNSGAGQSVATGEKLYANTTNNPGGLNTGCAGAGCHGLGGIANGLVKNIQGTTQQLIDNSVAGINGVPAVMVTRIQNAKIVDANSSSLMADYLGQVDPAVPLLNGAELYKKRCLLCHGINADGVPPAGMPIRGLDIKGAKGSQILNAINQVVTLKRAAIPLMKGIRLSSVEAGYLEKYLAIPAGAVGSAISGAALFATKCQTCHGPGSGGLAKSIVNTTVIAIDLALANVPKMNNVNVTKAQEKMDIVAYLSGPLYPQPTTGMALFEMYCSYCHGLDGKGGMVAEKSIAGKTFTAQEIMDAYSGGIEAMTNSNLSLVGFTLNGPVLDLSLIAIYIEQLKGGN